MARGMKIKVDVAGFHEQLHALADDMDRATRPAAQAGAEIIYRLARIYAPVADSPHMFYGEGGAYGPFKPGSLRDSIYQVFSEDNSYKDVSTYHISWNATKAPYGAMVELGTSRAAAHPFIGRAVKESKVEVKEVMKARFIEEVTGK